MQTSPDIFFFFDSRPFLAFHHGYELPHAEASHRRELTQGRLQEKERDPSEHQRQEVRDEKGPCTQQKPQAPTALKSSIMR